VAASDKSVYREMVSARVALPVELEDEEAKEAPVSIHHEREHTYFGIPLQLTYSGMALHLTRLVTFSVIGAPTQPKFMQKLTSPPSALSPFLGLEVRDEEP